MFTGIVETLGRVAEVTPVQLAIALGPDRAWCWGSRSR